MIVIAEVGVNHDGDPKLAERLATEYAERGADYVKFQVFRTASVITEEAPKANYQLDTTGTGSQREMVEALELDYSHFRGIKNACESAGSRFLATPAERESLAFLVNDLGCDSVKIGSGDLDNLPFLIDVGASGTHAVLSTGMSTLGEIEMAIQALCYGRSMHEQGKRMGEIDFPAREQLLTARGDVKTDPAEFITVLHCTSEYPAAHETLNLSVIPLLRDAFGLPVGLSDHSTDHVAAIMSVAYGSTVIERHVTYDRAARGPDHSASLDYAGFEEMMRLLKLAEASAGVGYKTISAGEMNVRSVARKRIVAGRTIAQGEEITADALAFKRTGRGLAAGDIFSVIGTKARRDFAPDEVIEV